MGLKRNPPSAPLVLRDPLMYHGRHSPNRSDISDGARPDRLASFVSFTTEDGSAVIYDIRQPTAWITSDHAVLIDSSQ
ncbi:DUF7331 family protein [Natronorubrum texcoconense]